MISNIRIGAISRGFGALCKQWNVFFFMIEEKNMPSVTYAPSSEDQPMMLWWWTVAQSVLVRTNPISFLCVDASYWGCWNTRSTGIVVPWSSMERAPTATTNWVSGIETTQSATVPRYSSYGGATANPCIIQLIIFWSSFSTQNTIVASDIRHTAGNDYREQHSYLL